MALDAWQARILALRDSLLTLEINTVVSDEISAQKMPEVPLALHALVQVYADYVATAGFQVTEALLARAIMRTGGIGDSNTAAGARAVVQQLALWPFPNRAWTPAERLDRQNATALLPEDTSDPATDLTNGAESFEALQWAAWGALEHCRAGGTTPHPVDKAVLARIGANCRQLKEAAMRLEQDDLNRGSDAVRARLQAALLATPAQRAQQAAEQTRSQLFGATAEETTRSLFEHPRPVFHVDPDVTVLIRKAWDLGISAVSMQTVMQVDGDVMQVVGAVDPAEQAFIAALHRDAVRDGVLQWRSLFDVLMTAARDLAGVIRRAV